MTTTKSLLVAALLSTVAAVSFAQAPAAPNAAPTASAPHAVKAPADSASAPMNHKKHHAKKAAASTPAAAASATK